MKKLQNNISSIFDVVAYFAQLNLQWLFFTFLGGIVLGIGPSTATLIEYLNDYRENKEEHSFKEFWQSYKNKFKQFSLIGLAYSAFYFLLILNIRIISVFFKAFSFAIPFYLLFSIILMYIALLSFFTYAKAEGTSFKECLKASFFLSFRFPLQSLAMILSWYTLFLMFSAKTSLFIVFGISLLIFLSEFFHSQMIKKMKNLQSKWR